MFSKTITYAFTSALRDYTSATRKLYDSGCSTNMLNSSNDFQSLSENLSEEVSLADGSSIFSKGVGISSIYGRAMYVPDLTRGLISTVQDDLEGRFTLFGNKRVLVTDEEPLIIGNILRTGTLVNNKQYLSDNENDICFAVEYNNTDFIYPIPLLSTAIASSALISIDRWKFIHEVTAHTPLSRINAMIENNTLIGLPKTHIKLPLYECKSCILAKMKRKKIPNNKLNRPQSLLDNQRTYKPFEVVGCDIVDCGNILSLQGNKYCTVFIDFGTDLTSVYFHQTKDEFFTKCLKPYYYDVINPANGRIDKLHYLQSDDDSIFNDSIVHDFLGERGCRSRKSAPHHHIQNIRVEKAIHTLFDSATACMIESGCPKYLFESAIDYAFDARNDNITNRNSSASPTQLYTGIKPSIEGKYPFFHPAYFILQHHKKFNPRSQQCYILRLQPGYKNAYLLYTPYSASKLYVRFDVRASKLNKFEDITTKRTTTLPPLSIPTIDTENNTKNILYNNINDTNSYSPTSPIFELSPQLGRSHDPSECDDSTSLKKLSEEDVSLRGIQRRARKERKRTELIETRARQSEKRLAKIKQLSSRLGPYWVPESDKWTPADDVKEQQGLEKRKRIHLKRANSVHESFNRNLHTPGRTPTRKKRQVLNLQAISAENSGMPPTPTTPEEALNGPNAAEWKAAIEAENISIATQNTYEPAPFYTGKTVKSKIAFRVTRETDGTFKFKARLVAKGFTERKGYDYFLTFAPTVLTKSVHMILHIAATNDWEIRNLDVGSAYLEADIDTELYMEIPKEFDTGTGTRVRLRKSIYGLKQSGELWNKHIHNIFTTLGFTRSLDDPCMYARINGVERTYICLYVDDILIIGSNLSIILQLEDDISKKVKKLKSMGNTTRFVGIDITRDRALRKIYLSQEQFISDLVSS